MYDTPRKINGRKYFIPGSCVRKWRAKKGECMKTYSEVAEKLEEPQKTRFLTYMQLRWGDPKDEEIKCRVGYASEWAERFKEHMEMLCSDNYGKQVLRSIDPDYYGKGI